MTVTQQPEGSRLAAELGSEDPRRRASALQELARTDLQSIVRHRDQLVSMAASDASTDLRYMARQLLGALERKLAGAAPAAPAAPAPAATLDAPDPRSRLEAVEAIRQRGDRAEADGLAARIENETDARVLAAMAAALGKIGSSQHLPQIKHLLKSEDPRVCANAVEAVVAVGGDIAVESLLPLLVREDNRLQANLMVALHPRFPEQVTGFVSRMLRSPKFSVRASGLYCVRHLDPAEMVPDVVELMRSEEKDEVFAAAAAWLGEQSVPDSLLQQLEVTALATPARTATLLALVESRRAANAAAGPAPPAPPPAPKGPPLKAPAPGEPPPRLTSKQPAPLRATGPQAVRRTTSGQHSRRTTGAQLLPVEGSPTLAGRRILVTSVTSIVLGLVVWMIWPSPDAAPAPVAGSASARPVPGPGDPLPKLEGVVLSVDPDRPVIEVSVQGSRFRTALPDGAPLDLSRGRGITMEDVRFVKDGPESSRLTAGKVEFKREK